MLRYNLANIHHGLRIGILHVIHQGGEYVTRLNIFISYRSTDREFVRRLADDLKRLGHTVWFDPELTSTGGQAWWDNILAQIGTCDLFVFAVSDDSLASAVCQREYYYAAQLHKRILPVVIRPSELSNLPYELKAIQFVAYEHANREEVIALAGSLANLPPPVAPPDPLPEPPPVQIGEQERMIGEVEKLLLSDRLSEDQQAKMLFYIEKLADEGAYKARTTDMLRRFLERDDLLTGIARKVESIQQRLASERTARPIKRSVLLVMTLVGIAALVLIGLIGIVSGGLLAHSGLTPTTMPQIAAALTQSVESQTAFVAQRSLTATPSPTRSLGAINSPVAPTVTPYNLNDFVAQTKASWDTATANAVASFTQTPTPTPTPSLTFTDTPNIQKSVEAIFTATAQQATANAVASFTRTPLPTATFTPTPLLAGSQRTDPTGITQVFVPAGCFNMGSTDQQVQDAYAIAKKLNSDAQLAWFLPEEPQHQVCVTKDYWIDQYDVTNAAFDAFVKADGYSINAYWSTEGLKWRQANNITGPVSTCALYSNTAQQPRICISWYEAEAYATWRTKTANDQRLYRLPTEAQWEYAARGPKSLIYPWGDTFDGTWLNFCDKNCPETWADKSIDDGYAWTSPVGHYTTGKSWVNAYDMAGNVIQWTADWYSGSYYQRSPPNDPTGPSSGQSRVVRGGSWSGIQDYARAAFRGYYTPDDRLDLLGFRLVSVPSE